MDFKETNSIDRKQISLGSSSEIAEKINSAETHFQSLIDGIKNAGSRKEFQQLLALSTKILKKEYLNESETSEIPTEKPQESAPTINEMQSDPDYRKLYRDFMNFLFSIYIEKGHIQEESNLIQAFQDYQKANYKLDHGLIIRNLRQISFNEIEKHFLEVYLNKRNHEIIEKMLAEKGYNMRRILQLDYEIEKNYKKEFFNQGKKNEFVKIIQNIQKETLFHLIISTMINHPEMMTTLLIKISSDSSDQDLSELMRKTIIQILAKNKNIPEDIFTECSCDDGAIILKLAHASDGVKEIIIPMEKLKGVFDYVSKVITIKFHEDYEEKIKMYFESFLTSKGLSIKIQLKMIQQMVQSNDYEKLSEGFKNQIKKLYIFFINVLENIDTPYLQIVKKTINISDFITIQEFFKQFHAHAHKDDKKPIEKIPLPSIIQTIIEKYCRKKRSVQAFLSIIKKHNISSFHELSNQNQLLIKRMYEEFINFLQPFQTEIIRILNEQDENIPNDSQIKNIIPISHFLYYLKRLSDKQIPIENVKTGTWSP